MSLIFLTLTYAFTVDKLKIIKDLSYYRKFEVSNFQI